MTTETLLPKTMNSSARADADDVHCHPAIQAKLAELQARTISYNRELLRLTSELNEIRATVANGRMVLAGR